MIRKDEYGPNSTEVGIATGMVDEAIGRLWSYLESSGKYNTTNLIIVSDHGMALLDPSRVIFLDDCFDVTLAQIIDWSPNCFILPNAGDPTLKYFLLEELYKCKVHSFSPKQLI